MMNSPSTYLTTEDWEHIIDTFQNGIYVTNAEGLTLEVNSAYEKITGISAKRVIGRYIDDIVREGILSTSITKDVVATGQEVIREQRVQSGKHVVLRGVPIYKGNQINLVVTTVQDITVINQLQTELSHSRALATQYKERLTELEGSDTFVAESPEFRAAIALAQRVARVGSTVLILGESGTGKEVLAREIHEKSPRHDQLFLKINCGAIPENLLEAELFGYEGGAFTGAKRSGHVGLFEEASNGTLFLDEIGDMPLHLQVKLLRVLQERTVTRIGSTKAISVNTRVIAATNQNLEQMVKEKKFREDLYYRLNIVVIKSPPLRDRKKDIPGLIHFFVSKLNEKYDLNKQLAPELVAAFMEYDWPGNVRELENMIERLLVTSSEDIISLESARLPWAIVGPSLSAQEVSSPFEEITLKEAFDRVERQLLQDAVKRFHTTYQIAEALQISQPSVSRKLKKYGLALSK
ncbi:sigma 54-interacting transcriptional regulator [Flavonifractor plautii]|jgi:PAS modulated sigma54 specific transcriptional regulator, fis family|uniref:sigma-54 interaction domain-containing protein n=1 Tax=Flavonifractor plautii TaxID=292800 RepID=UPI00189B4654|nr:sigma 54-interacting transcriptional regulator [Flavonifractor plautii]MBS5658970.1 sigma 54-interacting transcriptional regulator [Oscillibacter sp.]MDB7910312.1 sigma 54-interacting transcriptional regulator [Flavonifractor plautii]MDB7913863.1 sigma 54-interacting transcriptional regulator [Flavonifractor plautii]